MNSPEQALPASLHLEIESVMKTTNPTQFPQLVRELKNFMTPFDSFTKAIRRIMEKTMLQRESTNQIKSPI
jgi:hypothetical protein